MTMAAGRSILRGDTSAEPDLETTRRPGIKMPDLSSGANWEIAQIKDFIPTRHCVPIDIRWACERATFFHWK